MTKSRYPFILIFFIIILTVGTFPQTLNYRNYSEKDGLASSEVYCVHQDSIGYVWLGTRNGLSRFDGIEFKNYFVKDGLLDNCILVIAEDTSGIIWLGTGRGLSCFSSGGFTNYTVQEGLPHPYISSIAIDEKGIYWIGTKNGLSRFDSNRKKFKNYTTTDGLVSNIVTSLVIDDHGILWVGTKKGLNSFSRNKFHTYTRENGLVENYIFGLFVDSRGYLWVGTQNGVSCLKDGKLSSYNTGNGLSHDSVNGFSEDVNGNIYMGTWNGVSVFSEGKFSYTNTKNGLSNDFVTSLIHDREGNWWITTYSGVSCLKSGNIVKYTVNDGLASNVVRAILLDKNSRYWFGTDNGLNCLSNGKISVYTQEDGLVNNSISTLFEDRSGRIWIGTIEGISVFYEGDFINIVDKTEFSNNVIFGFAQDKNGVVWICTKKGLLRFKHGKLDIPTFCSKGNHVFDFLEDKNDNLWFASFEGAYKYSPKSDQLKLYTIEDGLVDNSVKRLFEDRRHRIWIGTDRGLTCFENGRLSNYTMNEGLAGNMCNFILEDSNGSLWIGTEGGLSCFDGTSFQTYNSTKNGLIEDIWYCGLEGRNGTLWFGGPHGINTFKPPLKSNPVPPPVDITSVKVMGKEEPLTGVHLFDHERNNFKFDFAGLCFTAPESVTYNFQLKGMDKNWQETKDRTVFYPYLPPGNYTFRVKAYNNDGVESLKPAEFSFQILPPYWKTWWFVTLAFLVVLLMMFVFFHWHFKRMEEKKTLEARTRQLMMSQRMELMGMLAAGAVHDMKNLMTIIIGYSNIIERDADIDDKHNQLLIHIKETANTAVQVVKQILKFSRQKLHPSTTAGNMVFMMDEILELLRVTTPDRITLIWEPPLETILYRINPIRLQQVVMNLCINAIHAMPSGGSLEVSLKRTPDNGIRLVVSDTGKGMEQEVQDRIFDPLFTTKEDGKGTGLGLFVVKQIVEECKGTISFRSQPGVGTTFTIVFPVSE